MTESLHWLADAMRSTATAIDADDLWSRVAARIAAPASSPAFRRGARAFRPGPPVQGMAARRWWPALAVPSLVCAACLLSWRQVASTAPPPARVAVVRLELTLWHPDAIADLRPDSATDDLIALLAPRNP